MSEVNINTVLGDAKAFLESPIKSLAEALNLIENFVRHHLGDEPEAGSPAIVEPTPVTPAPVVSETLPAAPVETVTHVSAPIAVSESPVETLTPATIS
jgi:hypothetical protein